MKLSPEISTPSSECKPLDEVTFRRELTRLYPNCLRFARSLTRDRERAADAVQEAMLAIFEGSARPKSLETLTGWTLGVVKNRVYRLSSSASAQRDKVDGHQIVVETFGFDRAEQPDDRLEALAILHSRPASQRAALIEALTGGAPRAVWPDPVHEDETRALLRRQLGNLTDRQQNAVRLVVLEEKGLKLTASLLGINVSSVRDRLRGAVKRAQRLEPITGTGTISTRLLPMPRFFPTTIHAGSRFDAAHV